MRTLRRPARGRKEAGVRRLVRPRTGYVAHAFPAPWVGKTGKADSRARSRPTSNEFPQLSPPPGGCPPAR